MTDESGLLAVLLWPPGVTCSCECLHHLLGLTEALRHQDNSLYHQASEGKQSLLEMLWSEACSGFLDFKILRARFWWLEVKSRS